MRNNIKYILIVLLTSFLSSSCNTFSNNVESFTRKLIDNPSRIDELVKDTNFVFIKIWESIPIWKIDRLKTILSDYKSNKYSLRDYNVIIYHDIKWISYFFNVPDSDRVIHILFKLYEDDYTKSWKIAKFDFEINSY